MCGRFEEWTKCETVIFISREQIISGNVIRMLRKRKCKKIENVNSNCYLW